MLSNNLGQSQSETPGEKSAKSDQEPQITADADADPKEPDTFQTSPCGHEGAEVMPATEEQPTSKEIHLSRS